MESNGQPGRIHVSEATAHLLEQSSKSSWLVPRDDTIVAKGKGEMHTFWAHPRGRTATSTTSSGSHQTKQSPSKRSTSSSSGANEPEVAWEDTCQRLAQRYPCEFSTIKE